MWTTTVTRTTTASKQRIWSLWQDVANWNTWDHEIESVELFGNFQVGTKGVLKPLGGPKTKFEILECVPLQTFTDRSYLPMCKMDFKHSIKETAHGLEITHQVTMTGLTTFLFSKVIGKNVEKGLPTAVEKLIALAEKDSVSA